MKTNMWKKLKPEIVGFYIPKPAKDNGPLPKSGIFKFLNVAKVACTDLRATFKEAWCKTWWIGRIAILRLRYLSASLYRPNLMSRCTWEQLYITMYQETVNSKQPKQGGRVGKRDSLPMMKSLAKMKGYMCPFSRSHWLQPTQRLSNEKEELVILVNRRSFLNERYLSASLYRPNDGYMRWNECVRRDLCDRWDAREISEEKREGGSWDRGFWIWSRFWEDIEQVGNKKRPSVSRNETTLSMSTRDDNVKEREMTIDCKEL